MDEHRSAVVIGAGPANLALAVAIEEIAPELAANTLLVERHDDVRWQRGMLLPWTQSQVSFLKDLVTLRNPRSKFSFVNFLHSQGRLDDFINLGSMTPYRSEISRYLSWVAGELELVQTRYGQDVTAVEPAPREKDGPIAGWRVRFASGDVVHCEDVVIGVGRDARVPPVFAGLPRDRVIHSAEFVPRSAQIDPETTRRIVVVGGAQSAAEMLWSMYQALPKAQCTLVMRAIGLQAYESSRFTNELFFPSFVDDFFDAGPEARQDLLRGIRRTNYAGLTPDMIDVLYRQMYLDRVEGAERIEMITSAEIIDAQTDDDEVVLTLVDRVRGITRRLHCDLVLLGTGFESTPPRLVRNFVDTLGLDAPVVSRNYRMALPEHFSAGCYLVGINEETHGIADSLMSILGVRAGEIVNDLLRTRESPPWRYAGSTAKT